MYTKNLDEEMSSWPAQLDVLPLTMPTLLIEMDYNHFGWHDGVMRWLLDSLTGADGPHHGGNTDAGGRASSVF